MGPCTEKILHLKGKRKKMKKQGMRKRRRQMRRKRRRRVIKKDLQVGEGRWGERREGEGRVEVVW